VIDTQENIEYKLSKQGLKIILDLKQPKLLSRTYKNLFYKDSRIQKTTIKRTGKNVKVNFWLKKSYKVKSFFLKPNKKYKHHRLVIDIIGAEKQQTTISKTSKKINKTTPKIVKKIIVIDAGHGGEDPGALGSKVQEKHLVLSVAKKLQKLLNNNPKFKAILTRKSDYFVSLKKRPAMGQNYQADAFLSIHADSAIRKSANGASVYTLSKKGGTTALAKKLEKTENADDIFGNENINKDWVLNTIMRDLARNNKKTESVKLASNILTNLGKISKLHKKTPQKANFVVLKTPAIPSVLIEIGFISNPQEERRLRKNSEQIKVANAIYNGVLSHFKNSL
jgi:N-acetylmuramoyl-L-alanine amidase